MNTFFRRCRIGSSPASQFTDPRRGRRTWRRSWGRFPRKRAVPCLVKSGRWTDINGWRSINRSRRFRFNETRNLPRSYTSSRGVIHFIAPSTSTHERGRFHLCSLLNRWLSPSRLVSLSTQRDGSKSGLRTSHRFNKIPRNICFCESTRSTNSG